MIEAFMKLDDIDKGKVLERINVLLEQTKYNDSIKTY